MKAILIARVSTEEQKEAGNSLPAQVARLEKYCQNKGFTIQEVYSFDESAYTDDRTEFDGIIDLIINQPEKIAVCCDKVDRLSRNVFDKRISVLYDKALSDQLELHFVSDGQVITSRISAVEKFQFSISLGLAKYYSDAISDNVKRAQEQKLRKSEWLSKAPFGYKNIKRENGATDIIVDEYSAHIIRKIFELYASGTYSTEVLVQKINSEHGLKWPKSQMGKILKNPFFHGVMLVKGKEYPHRYPTIISPSLYDQAKQVREGFNKKPFKFAGKPFIYRGMLRCAHCDCAITAEEQKGNVYYHCTQYKGKHGAKWLREEEVTEQLRSVFRRLQVPADILAEIKGTLDEVHQNKIDFHNKEYEKITKEQKNVTKMMDNLYLDKLRGRITESEYDRFYQSFRDESAQLAARMSQLQDAEDNYYTTAKYVLDLVSRAYDLFESSEVEEKRQLIALVLSNLKIEGENVLYIAHSPFDLILNSADRLLWRLTLGTLRTFRWNTFKRTPFMKGI